MAKVIEAIRKVQIFPNFQGRGVRNPTIGEQKKKKTEQTIESGRL